MTATTEVACFVLERAHFAAILAEYEHVMAMSGGVDPGGLEGGNGGGDPMGAPPPLGTTSPLGALGGGAAPLAVDWSALKNLGKIGAGTFGTVLMMQDTRDNEVYAMKVRSPPLISCPLLPLMAAFALWLLLPCPLFSRCWTAGA